MIKIPFASAKAKDSKFSVADELKAEIEEGLADIAAGRMLGPFKNVKQFKRVLKARSGKILTS